jgi:hypothetical protein
MVALAGSDASTVPTNALAEKLDLSYNYLLTIVAELRRAGFVKMRRGPAGGLELARPAHEVGVAVSTDMCVWCAERRGPHRTQRRHFDTGPVSERGLRRSVDRFHVRA